MTPSSPRPKRRTPLAALALVAGLASGAVLAAGCATPGGPGACESAYRFPARFDLLQVVEVDRGGASDVFLASVRRRGERFDLALLDPVLARPLLEAAFADGGWTVAASELPPEVAGRLEGDLLEPVRSVYVAECFEREEGGLALTGPRFRTTLDPPAGGACPFPEHIRMRARGLTRFEVTATTRDVRCGDPDDEVPPGGAPAPAPAPAPAGAAAPTD